jgi:VIT1/CCC1 family predicted Fe2+/Mn2+ transporter
MININKFSMGATAAIITSLGLIAGLAHSDSARSSVIAGLLIIAVADNIADSLGIHIYKEGEGLSRKEIYSSTFGNFTIRLILALSFVAIVQFLPSQMAFIVSVIWGLLLLSILSYYIGQAQKENPIKEIILHLLVAALVIVGSKFLGNLILNKV